MKDIKSFNKFISGLIGSSDYDVNDKKFCAFNHILYMLNRTQSMFKWSNLPDTIPERILELYLQTNGNVCFYEYENNLYVFTGGLGGEPDVYYRPTIYTIANPALKISKSLKIDDECVVMPNDSLFVGLLPLFKRYAYNLSENELSIKIAIINSRIVDLISASDDKTKISAEKYLDDITEGKLGVIASNEFFDGIKAQPYSNNSNNSTITNLIEMEQYLKASLFNEIGLNANYNMKRESLNTSESQMNNDALLPLVDNMFKCRQDAIKKVNEKYNLNISVDFASSWQDNIEEIELEHEAINENSGQPENVKTEVEANENL